MRCMFLHCLRQVICVAFVLALSSSLLQCNMIFADDAAVAAAVGSNSGANKANDVHSLAGWV